MRERALVGPLLGGHLREAGHATCEREQLLVGREERRAADHLGVDAQVGHVADLLVVERRAALVGKDRVDGLGRGEEELGIVLVARVDEGDEAAGLGLARLLKNHLGSLT